MNPCKLKYSSDEISVRRNYIYQTITKYLAGVALSNPGSYQDPVNGVYQMQHSDIDGIFWLYDQVFFQGAFRRFFEEHPNDLFKIVFGDFGQPDQWNNFGQNGEMIDTTGISGHSQLEIISKLKKHTIFISRPIFSSLFQDGQSFQSANGLYCRSQLDCLLLTLEHEIVHLLIDLFCDTRKNGHGADFKELVQNIFGHSDVTHSLGVKRPGENYLCDGRVVNRNSTDNGPPGCQLLYKFK